MVSDAANPSRRDAVTVALLAAGMVLRVLVFFFTDGLNPDRHVEVIDFIATYHALPVSNALSQSYHPPLYHVLMAPVWSATHSVKALQFVSLVLSAANLLLIAQVLKSRLLNLSITSRRAVLAIACFLPQFVMFSGFVSNDSLAFLFGTLLAMAVMRYVDQPTARRRMAMAFVVAAGLLTKGTFLLAGPIIALVVAPVERRIAPRRGIVVGRVAMFCAIWIVLGSYKYIENAWYFHRPIVHNLDPDTAWKREEQGRWPSAAARWNLDFSKLLREPILKIDRPASYPMLMYATLWYPHWPDSSFRGNVNGYAWVGRVMYVLGIVPTAAFLWGTIGGLFAVRAAWRGGDRAAVMLGFALLLCANIAIVMAAGIRYDVWSCFQSRLCFQSMLPGLVLLAIGMDRMHRVIRLFVTMMIALAAMWGAGYFVVEIALLMGWIERGTEVLPV